MISFSLVFLFSGTLSLHKFTDFFLTSCKPAVTAQHKCELTGNPGEKNNWVLCIKKLTTSPQQGMAVVKYLTQTKVVKWLLHWGLLVTAHG